jgi:Tol biopolymer transport system component
MKKQPKILFASFLSVLGLVLFVSGLSSQRTAGELFEKALYQEEAQGDLQKAIGMYEKILEQYPGDRETAAKAQLHIGLCYEKLGLEEAQKAFQKVVENYPDQSAAVTVAREKLSALTRARSLIEKGGEELTIRQVWTGPGADNTGAVSPNGRFLSFVDWQTGDLAIRELDTGKNRRLTQEGSWTPSPEFALFSKWSPDSRQLVYQWFNKDQTFELRVVDVEQPKPRVLFRSQDKMSYVQAFDWSPDGKQILAIFLKASSEGPAFREDATFQLGFISAEDGGVRYLKKFDVGVNRIPYSFTFSPDGKWIAYDSQQKDDPFNRDIYLLSADGSREVLLVDHPALDYVLGWTPDGKGLLFGSERMGSRGAWFVPVFDGRPQGSPQLIKPDVGPIEAMGYTKQGAFFYGLSQDIFDVYTVGLDPTTAKILDPIKKVALHYEGHNAYPAYSPDGMSLAYMSSRKTLGNLGSRSHEVLCLLALKTGEIRELRVDLAMFGYPRWSPEGRYISLEGRGKDGRPSIFRFDTQTGEAIPLVQFDGGPNLFSHRWSRDGKSVFYAGGGRTGEPSYVYVHDIETGQDRKLVGSPSDAKDIDISPDGKWLALINRDQKRTIKIMPASGGDPREIYSFEHAGNPVITPAWSADGSYILFSKKRPDPDQMWDLYRISAEGGEAQKIDLSMNEFRHLSVHPDGRHIAFSSEGYGPRYAEVWVMENFLPGESGSIKRK